jgi:hypothetical protein
MQNIEMNQEGDILTLKIDLSKRQGRSKSGLTEIIASSQGNVSAPNDRNIKIGLNVYLKPQAAPADA